MAKRLFLLNGGHGANTAGKRSPDGTLREYNFNNPVAALIGSMLRNEYDDVIVEYVYNQLGEDTPLIQRTNKANELEAKYGIPASYVAIHGNAHIDGQWTDANGTETFVYVTNPKEARALAEVVQADLVKATGLRNRGVKMADFHELRETNMTAILVEVAFMTNRKEADLMKSKAFQELVARTIVGSLAKFYNLKKKVVAPKPVPAPTQKPQQVVEGKSTLSVEDANAVIKVLSDAWFKATTDGEKDRLHSLANKVRIVSGQKPTE